MTQPLPNNAYKAPLGKNNNILNQGGSPRVFLQQKLQKNAAELLPRKQSMRSSSGKGLFSHKKAQSLLTSNVSDIIQGLQSSLGIIANNMKNSFSNEEIQILQASGMSEQKRALIESAILAQKIAKLTHTRGNSLDHETKTDKQPPQQSHETMSDTQRMSTSDLHRFSDDPPGIRQALHHKSASEYQNPRRQTHHPQSIILHPEVAQGFKVIPNSTKHLKQSAKKSLGSSQKMKSLDYYYAASKPKERYSEQFAMNAKMKAKSKQTSQLKSVASSPSLHQYKQSRDGSCGSKKVPTLNFEYLDGQGFKVQKKSDSLKRASYDGTSLSNMFHFKQQILINKFLTKEQQHKQDKSKNSNNSGSIQKFGITKPSIQTTSNFTSKKNSKEHTQPLVLSQTLAGGQKESLSQAEIKNFMTNYQRPSHKQAKSTLSGQSMQSFGPKQKVRVSNKFAKPGDKKKEKGPASKTGRSDHKRIKSDIVIPQKSVNLCKGVLTPSNQPRLQGNTPSSLWSGYHSLDNQVCSARSSPLNFTGRVSTQLEQKKRQSETTSKPPICNSLMSQGGMTKKFLKEYRKPQLDLDDETSSKISNFPGSPSTNSPKMKILPTPKAVKPGNQIDALQGQQFVPSTTKSVTTYLQKKQAELYKATQVFTPKVQTSKADFLMPQVNEQRLPTHESNLTTNYENLSPRTRDRRKLIKQIKVSFQKFNEPPKTTSEYYRIGKMLGKGAFGRVNLGMHKLTDHLVAVKSTNKQLMSEDEDSKKKIMQEVMILQKIKHPNIVKLYDSFETTKHIVFVMEICSGGDLLNFVRKRKKLSEDIAKYFFTQIVDALQYCHKKHIVHRDIKLDNVLLTTDGQIKLCDFGVSKHLKEGETMTEQCGTPAYIAPEILRDKGYQGFAVDIWSLGVCLYAMLYGTVPFKANNMSELHQLILKAKYSLKEDKFELSDEVKSLLKGLLEPDPFKRLTLKQIKKHPWLDNIQSVEIFSPEEIQSILKDFTYNDVARFNRNNDQLSQIINTEHNFTEHALDSTKNALLRNNSTKSVILAPFNSTRTKMDPEELGGGDLSESMLIPPLEINESMMLDKKVIKFAARVKDLDRQYEMNNNCELDNGVYNKFVQQSTENISADKEKSLLITKNSDEEAEDEILRKREEEKNSELYQLQNIMKTHMTETNQSQDSGVDIDYSIVETIEEFGYPREFIEKGLENLEMNDATTGYYLLEKEKYDCAF